MGEPRRLDDELRLALDARLPWLGELGQQVAALGLPLTLTHNDLHADNVVEVAGRLRVFDFGDAVLTEPLALLSSSDPDPSVRVCLSRGLP